MKGTEIARIEMSEDDDIPKLPAEFRMKPSRNSKQRSKLTQGVDETMPAADPTPAAESAAPSAAPAPTGKRVHLKRSGKMHDDLTAPPDEEAKASPRQSEY